MTERSKKPRTFSQYVAGLSAARSLVIGPTHTPDYQPVKHTVETYRAQQRRAKKRRKLNAKKSKR